MLERRPKDLFDPDEALSLVALRDLEDPGFRLIEDLIDLALTLVIDIADDLRRLLDESPQQRLVANDARVILEVGRRGHGIDERGEIVEPPGRFHLAGLLELLRDRDHVDHVPALEEADHGPVEPSVRLPIEHGVVEELDGPRHCVPVDQHAAQYGGLRLERERRDPIEYGLGEVR